MTASSGGRGISGMLASPRRRRRLRWGAVLLGAGGVVALGVILLPDNNGDKLPAARPGKPTLVAPAPKHVRMGAADQAAAKLAAAKFIDTAVLRRHIDASWNLTAPELRAGFTREAWKSGDIPVVPFPANDLDSVRYKTDYTIKNHIGYQVSMLPRENSTTEALLFSMELVKRGPATSPHWMVDYWAPISPGVLSPTQRAKQAQEVAASSRQPIGSGWLLLPILGIFVLIIALPIVLLVRGKLRHRRAERAYRDAHSPAQTSSSSPS
ncbi:MAG TPA: hypothetical protein VFU10_03195 [Gaiellaceae bacterium]|nr:hypothetical protein [Gaiellaceae bacterium]